MAESQNLNIGIIKVDVNEYYSDAKILLKKFEDLLSTQKEFVASSCKRRNIEGDLLKLSFLIEEWTCYENISLIFILGNEVIPSYRISNQSFCMGSLNQPPYVSKLMFSKEEALNRFSAKFDIFMHEKAIILSLVLSSKNLEYVFENIIADLVCAVKEINSCIKDSSVGEPQKKIHLKSRVEPLKVAERPRHSVFPMLSVSDAVACVLNESQVLSTTWKSFEDSLSFVLAENVIAKEPYPPFNASIKDGYAVLADDGTTIRDVVGAVTPGCELDFDLRPGTCVRVSTGSAIPHLSDAVIQVEDTEVAEKDSEGNEIKIEILKPVKKLQDIRIVGCDVTVGEVLIPCNRKISAAEIGVLALSGIQNVFVHQKPRVALLSTGDEILEPHVPLKPGCIRDSNKSSLMSLLVENKIPFVDVGIARDTADDIKSRLVLAMKSANIIVSTGSVSMGEKDLLKSILLQDFDATIHFGRVHMKPGKPTTFSTVMYDGELKLVFSLPGNPVSACVCFFLFVVPCIKKLMGYEDPHHAVIKVELAHDIKLDERPEFYRVSLKPGSGSTYTARGTGGQQSSRLLSMQNADALLVLPPKSADQTIIEAGSIVNAILLQPI